MSIEYLAYPGTLIRAHASAKLSAERFMATCPDVKSARIVAASSVGRALIDVEKGSFLMVIKKDTQGDYVKFTMLSGSELCVFFSSRTLTDVFDRYFEII
tara:strand:- start:5408 stop:5707 length:300 start_codon:yes stop_codon:yes gene_type:complete